MALEGAGRFDEAIAAWQRAIEREPGWAAARARLGELLWSRRGDLAGAESALRAACALDPAAVAARQQLGLVLLEQGRQREALGPLEQAAALAPDHPVVLRTWAEALSAMPERSRQAAEVWRRYLEASRDWPAEERHRAAARDRLRAP
jgi:tetratricopeptide (TPR) repeat protein